MIGIDIVFNVKVLECFGGVMIVYGVLNDGINFCVLFEGVVVVKEGEGISLNVDLVDCYVFDVNGKVLCCFNVFSIVG